MVACAGSETATSLDDDTSAITSLKILPESASAAVGSSLVLRAELSSNGTPLATTGTIEWTSSDTAIARVDASGSVTALDTGIVEILAKSGTASARSRFRATSQPVGYVIITPDNGSVQVGASLQLSAATYSWNMEPLPGRPVEWLSNHPQIATIDGTGKVTALAAGTASINARSEGRIGVASVTVTTGSDTTPPPPTPTAPGTVSTLAVASAASTSSTLRFTEVGNGSGGAAGYIVKYAAGSINWSTANLVTSGTCATPMAGTTVGAVRTCTVNGLAPSTAYQFQVVAFRGTYGQSEVQGSPSNVASGTTTTPPPTQAPVASITVAPASDTVLVGQTTPYTATLRDSAGNVLSGRAVTWTSTNTGVATVNGSGVATGVAAGAATIRASSEGRMGSAAILVQAPAPAAVATVTVAPSSGSVAVGAGAQFTATLRDAAGNVLSGRAVTWSSSNNGIATVNSSGLATGVAAGAANITAASEGRSGSASLTVTAAPPPGNFTFSSNWGTATGTSDAALRDGGKWNTLYCQQAANTATVVPGSTVGWTRTANVLRLQQLGPTQCGTLEKVNAVPLSTTHWGRLFFRNDEIGTRHNHVVTYNPGVGAPIQVSLWNRYGTAAGVNIFIRTYYTSAGAATSYPTNIWSMGTQGRAGLDFLPHGRWYRYEWQMEYVTATRYRIWPRIYDMNGALLYDASRFFQSDYNGSASQHSLASWYAAGNTFGFTDANLATRFGLGNEGPGNSGNTGGYWYHADVALTTGGWIGGQ